MAHDAGDVAKVLRLRPAHRDAGDLPRRRARASTARRRATASSSTCAATCAASTVEDGRRAGAGAAGDGARPREPRARPARPQARPRPGVDRHRTRRRRDRQQLGRDALRRRRTTPTARSRSMTFVLPSGTVIDTGRAGRRGALRGGRAASSPRAGRDPRRDPRRRRARRADPAQVRDQEHDRLPALRVPRRRHAAGDLPAPASSAPRGRWRSSPRRCSRPCRWPTATTVSLAPLPDIDAAIAPGRRPRRRRRPRGRADGRAGADRRQPQHPRHAGELARAPPESAALLVEFGADDEAELDARERRARRSCSRPAS